MKKIVSIIIILVIGIKAFSQEEQEWKPQTLVTGYVNTVAEFTDAKKYVEAKGEKGIGVADAGVLISYKPLEKLELKTTLVYSHFIPNIQSLVVEAFGKYKVSDALIFGAGKFLTPLSPVNQYFYAPVNISGFLPLVVSHHEIIPQSVSGFQIAGEFFDNFKLGYTATYGNYLTVGHPLGGMLGLQGSEDIAPHEYALNISGEERPYKYYLGGCARIYANWKDKIKLGINYFDGTRAQHPYVIALSPTQRLIKFTESKKYSLGMDLQMELGKFKINGEIWETEHQSDDGVLDTDPRGCYAEIMMELGKFTPYFRYDYIEDINTRYYAQYPDMEIFKITTETRAFGGGLTYRPLYEIMLKMDYRYFMFDYNDMYNQPTEKNYNHLMFSLIYSF